MTQFGSLTPEHGSPWHPVFFLFFFLFFFSLFFGQKRYDRKNRAIGGPRSFLGYPRHLQIPVFWGYDVDPLPKKELYA